MRFSRLFGRTLREAPSEAELISHQLALRAGLVRPLATGIYSYLPLGWRALQRIGAIVRAEMERIGAQELSMPLVQPAELWRATGRYDAPSPGPALVRFRDRNSHDMVLAMTHEEVATALARSEIDSYRQLPLIIYQIQPKFRDEPRPRGGLVRAREFLMQDAYSFDADEQGLEASYSSIHRAYLNILARCGLDVLPVEADTEMVGGGASCEFMVPHELGEDMVIRCPSCGYAANVETAGIRRGRPGGEGEAPLPLERVATPGATTITSLAHYLGVQASKTLKAVFFQSSAGELIFAVIRGDLDVNEAKLRRFLGGVELAPAAPEALRRVGIVPGYASPIGLEGVRVVADYSVREGCNWIAGANEEGYHLRNVNIPRDFCPGAVADIALARRGDPCPRCGEPLEALRCIEVGHTFKLGTRCSEALGATYRDASGASRPLMMGSYGLGLGRLLACIIEQHHDAQGIIWPFEVAPYDVHIVSLAAGDRAIEEAALNLCEHLEAQGYAVLLDDRDERAGVKFNDADLIGIPVRLTVSQRTVAQEAVELKLRSEQERRLVPQAEILAYLECLRGAGAQTGAA
ncbi:MAG: proline--tRNA ligase [Chloroflexi bacterium]|nr:proline--tRNA ligase [Chloroflexota bacterium]